MRQAKPLAGLIHRLLHDRGSITLEAALVAPLFLFLLLIFIVFIHISTVQMALQDAASQAVRQTAAYIYPIALATQSDNEQPPKQPASKPLAGIQATASQLSDWLPDPAGALLNSALTGNWEATANWAARYALEPLVRQYAEPSVLQADKLTVSDVELPDLKKGSERPYLSITVRYELPIRLPFVGRPIILREHAVERVWINDTLAGGGADSTGESADGFVQIIGLEPSPVRPGKKARLTVLTDPGQTLSITVEYKSGTSKAQNLGKMTADENGVISWEWHVSGNTTPGVWELVVTAEDGEQTRLHFEVNKG